VYSIDFRRKVFAIKAKKNLSIRELSKRMDIGVTTIVRWRRNITPKTTRNKPATKIDMDGLKQDVKDYPDGYNYERADRMKCSTTGIFEALRRLKITYKKKPQSSQIHPRRTAMLPRKDKILSQE
jgi:transposase